MKRLTIALAGAVLAGTAAIWGCGSSSTSPSPSNTTIFTVQLLGPNEPALTSQAEINAKGTAVITIHKDTNNIDFAVSMSNFPPNSSAIMAHIHGPNAPAGVAAGVFVSTGLAPGTAIQMPNGTGTFNLTMQTTADKVSQILASPSQFYFNVHTPLNPGGAIRGQLQ